MMLIWGVVGFGGSLSKGCPLQSRRGELIVGLGMMMRWFVMCWTGLLGYATEICVLMLGDVLLWRCVWGGSQVLFGC